MSGMRSLDEAVRKGWWYSVGHGPHWSGEGLFHGTAKKGNVHIEKHGQSVRALKRELLHGVNTAIGNRLA